LPDSMSEDVQGARNPEAPELTRMASVHPRRRRILTIVVVVLLAVSAYVGGKWVRFYMTHVTTDEAWIKGDLVTVSSKVPGEIVELFVDDGYRVEKNDPIATIDPRDYTAKVKEAEAVLEYNTSRLKKAEVELRVKDERTLAELAQAQADYEVSLAKLKQAEEDLALERKRRRDEIEQAEAALESARAQVDEYQARLLNAEQEYQRAIRLFQEGVVSDQDVDLAKREFEVEQARYDSTVEEKKKAEAALKLAKTLEDSVRIKEEAVQTAKGDVKRAEADLGWAEANRGEVELEAENIKTIRAEIAKAEATLEAARTNLLETRVVAPISGVVSRRIADLGEKMEERQPIAVLNDDTAVWVIANIQEKKIRKVRLDQPVEVKVDAYPGRIFSGRVINIGSATAAEFALIPTHDDSRPFTKVAQRIPVKIGVEDPGHELKPGMMVVVSINVKD